VANVVPWPSWEYTAADLVLDSGRFGLWPKWFVAEMAVRQFDKLLTSSFLQLPICKLWARAEPVVIQARKRILRRSCGSLNPINQLGFLPGPILLRVSIAGISPCILYVT